MSNSEREDIKNETDQKNNIVTKKVEKWAIIGVSGNLILTIIKFLAGILGRSNAMIADAIHSASDSFASLFVFISLKIAKKPADKNHPYGHYKAEVISTMIVGVMLWIAGYEIIKTSFALVTSEVLEPPKNIALYAALLSIAVKILMYRYTCKAGVQANSPATIANALDHRSDALSSIATFIGISGAKLGFPILDPIAGMVVSVFIFKMGYKIIVNAVKQIMEENIDDEKLDNIRGEALSVEGVRGTHDIRGRQSGAIYMIDMHIEVDRQITIEKAHTISESVRKKILKRIDNIGDITIHIDHN